MARRFARDEDGALLIMGIFVFLIILITAGIGVDLMRFERDRAALQNTLDRAALAAADLDQVKDPEEVVHDYLAKAGMLDYLSNVTVDQGFGYRSVSASAEFSFPTQFMHMSGVDSLTVPASTTAEERLDKLEVSMVLDVSGSMGSRNRLKNLKIAAKEFVDTVISTSAPGGASISIVPFSSQVNVGGALLSKFNVTNEHSYNNCVDFDDADYRTTAITVTQRLQRSGHFDPWSSYRYGTKANYRVCRTDSGSEIFPVSNNISALQNKINQLSASGNTSIEIGMKWGSALLDPAARPAIGDLVDDGIVDVGFDGRPNDFSDGGTLKVIVLMSDGENTTEYVMKDEYRDGPTDVWYDPKRKRFSIWGKKKSKGNNGWGNGDQCAPGNSSDHNNAENAGGVDPCVDWGYFYPHNRKWRDAPAGGSRAYRLSYPQLWNLASVSGHAYMRYQMHYKASDYYDWIDVYDDIRPNSKNWRSHAICDAAKDAGIVVYTISFEAPSNGKAVLMDCASSDSHYFDVKGLEIRDAFAAIASSIRKLRLTQ
ncbi:TadE/TadG family type IV pilus assembly protein [Jhaorihella thermophila]|nr:TadE/TadG family type IV pilus assembly protein [Jhaorihella thermophila]